MCRMLGTRDAPLGSLNSRRGDGVLALVRPVTLLSMALACGSILLARTYLTFTCCSKTNNGNFPQFGPEEFSYG